MPDGWPRVAAPCSDTAARPEEVAAASGIWAWEALVGADRFEQGRVMRREWEPEDLIACCTLVEDALAQLVGVLLGSWHGFVVLPQDKILVSRPPANSAWFSVRHGRSPKRRSPSRHASGR